LLHIKLFILSNGNYLRCVLVLTNSLSFFAFLHKILPISLQIRHELAGWASAWVVTIFTWGWGCELVQRLTSKGFQTGGVIYFGALHLVNRAFNLVTTYILVRCTYPNPNAPFYSCWWVTHKGQRPVILVKHLQTLLQVQRTVICCRF